MWRLSAQEMEKLQAMPLPTERAMKQVRNKLTKIAYDVETEFQDGVIRVMDWSGELRVFKSEFMEPIADLPQPTWRDVTAECEWVDGRLIHEYETEWAHHHTTICGGENYLHPGYRLTKISGPLTPHVAFIVEKQE